MNESTKPTEPGWYECRHISDNGFRVCRWWDGAQLFASPNARGIDTFELRSYTDFLGPLVPAREPGERGRDIAERIVNHFGYISNDDDHRAMVDHVAAILTESAPPGSGGEEVERLRDLLVKSKEMLIASTWRGSVTKTDREWLISKIDAALSAQTKASE